MKHGMSGTKAYEIWKGMRKRCYRKSALNYPRYGGRGIRVCDAWRDSVVAFWADMGPSYRPGLTLERIDNSGHYEPGNCCWATPKEQAYNRRDNHIIDTPWGLISIGEAAEKSGLKRDTIRHRVLKGYPQADLFKPPHHCNSRMSQGELLPWRQDANFGIGGCGGGA
jgi:hypothetical protein